MYGDQFGEFVCGYWGFKVETVVRCPWTLKEHITFGLMLLPLLLITLRNWDTLLQFLR